MRRSKGLRVVTGLLALGFSGAVRAQSGNDLRGVGGEGRSPPGRDAPPETSNPTSHGPGEPSREGIDAQRRSPSARGAEWDAFAESRRGECLGGRGTFGPPVEVSIGKHRYRIEGHRLIQVDRDRDDTLRLGVLSAIKDDRPETLDAVKRMIQRFKSRRMDILIANGDLAADEFQMEAIFPELASAAGVLVIAITGNTESCGSFNHIANDTFETHANFINGNWIRRLDLDDATLLTLPGYYDRRFCHTSGASTYDARDLEILRTIATSAPGPLVLVSHGPPRMKGRLALDVIPDGANVGDPAMTELIQDLRVPFGVFGHILEAGGRGTDLAGRKALRPRVWHRSLYVNAGTINPDPWTMLGGAVSHGMGMFIELRRNRARYFVERLPRPR